LHTGETQVARVFRQTRKGDGRRRALEVPRAAQDRELDREHPEQPLVCAACRHVITTESQRTKRGGRHRHTFANPNGHVFHIACFEGATGIGLIGARSEEHTWFADYTWQIVVCESCDEHLGWRFATAPDSFYGLIEVRLISLGRNG
jgi:hypothetical protein